MIYITALRRPRDLAEWLQSESSSCRVHEWTGRIAVHLALAGLNPAETLREALEPLSGMPPAPPGLPVAVALQLCCPVEEGDARYGAVDKAHLAGARAALRLLESEYAVSIGGMHHENSHALLAALAHNRAEHVVTITIPCLYHGAGGDWTWLDPWHLVSELPEVRIAYARGIADALARHDLSIEWSGPESAHIRRTA